MLPISLAKLVSIVFLAIVAAGIGILVWAAITTEGEEVTPTPSPLPTPAPTDTESPAATPSPQPEAPQSAVSGSRFTRDQAIAYTALFSQAENATRVEAELMTYAEAREATQTTTVIPGEPPDDAPTWLVSFTGRFFSAILGDFNATASPAGDPPCTTERIYLVEEPLSPVSSAVRDDTCDDPETIPREAAIFYASRYVRWRTVDTIPENITADLLPITEAAERHEDLRRMLPTWDFAPAEVWYVTLTGVFRGETGPLPEGPDLHSPPPQPRTCTEIAVVIHPRTDDVVTAAANPSDTCAAPDTTPTPAPSPTTPVPTPSLLID